MDKYDVKESDYEGYEIKITTSGAGLVKKGTTTQPTGDALNHRGKIPAGGTYYVGGYIEEGDWNFENATVYNEGDDFPSEVNLGDVYYYGDYKYMYGYFYEDHEGEIKEQESYFGITNNGWGVAANQQGSTLGIVLESVNNEPITCLAFVFCNTSATEFDEPFKVPDSVNNISWMFCCGSQLNGTVVINTNNIEDYSNAMYHANGGITLTGTSELLDEIATTNEDGNVTVDSSLE